MSYWRRYVPVAQRRAKAIRQMEKLRKKGKDIQPVEIEGKTIARTFWGKGWCSHLESFSDYANRLPRGRTYVRNGSVCHLEVQPGRIEAMVAGSSLYKVAITIEKLKAPAWKAIKERCSGQIGSMLELLQGKLSDQVMTVVSDRQEGLFPKPGEMKFSCSCPDWAAMCKHVASALYGVGNRLDAEPELLFLLRGVDAQELIAAELALPSAEKGMAEDALADDDLGAIFGVDLDADPEPPKEEKEPASASKPKRQRESRKAAAKKKPAKPKAAEAESPKKPAAPKKKTAKSPSAEEALPRIRPTGKTVARLRKKLGLSAAQFAQELGVTPASVYRWESTAGPLKLQARPLKAIAKLHNAAKGK